MYVNYWAHTHIHKFRGQQNRQGQFLAKASSTVNHQYAHMQPIHFRETSDEIGY